MSKTITVTIPTGYESEITAAMIEGYVEARVADIKRARIADQNKAAIQSDVDAVSATESAVV